MFCKQGKNKQMFIVLLANSIRNDSFLLDILIISDFPKLIPCHVSFQYQPLCLQVLSYFCALSTTHKPQLIKSSNFEIFNLTNTSFTKYSLFNLINMHDIQHPCLTALPNSTLDSR